MLPASSRIHCDEALQSQPTPCHITREYARYRLAPIARCIRPSVPGPHSATHTGDLLALYTAGYRYLAIAIAFVRVKKKAADLDADDLRQLGAQFHGGPVCEDLWTGRRQSFCERCGRRENREQGTIQVGSMARALGGCGSL